MSQNDQTHFKNLAAFAARFSKCVGPFYIAKGLRFFLGNPFSSRGISDFRISFQSFINENCPNSRARNFDMIST